MQLILSFRVFFGLRGSGHICGFERKMVKKVYICFYFVSTGPFSVLDWCFTLCNIPCLRNVHVCQVGREKPCPK